MKLANPQWVNTIQWDACHPAELCLENPDEYRLIVEDITLQSAGENGDLVFSDDNHILSLVKDSISIRDLWSVDLNQKKILTGVYKQLSMLSYEEYYGETMELLGMMGNLLERLRQDSMQSLEWDVPVELNPILKAFGVRLESSENLFERLVDYIRLCHEFLHIRLAILVGVRSFLPDADCNHLCRDIAATGVSVLFVEPYCRSILENGVRLTIDQDHCELLQS